jgi:orotate phosphoribosyltransferase
VLEELMDTARAELLEIIRKQSFMTGGQWVLSSGKTTDFYLDCKLTTLSHPRGRQLACQLMYEQIKAMKRRPDAIGGLTIGAAPLSLGISDLAWQHDEWSLPIFVVRDEQKEHGTKKEVEGSLEPGWDVVIVDDVMTTGRSVLKAIRAAKKRDARIAKVFILVDREDEDRDRKELANYDVVSLFTVTDLRAM